MGELNVAKRFDSWRWEASSGDRAEELRAAEEHIVSWWLAAGEVEGD